MSLQQAVEKREHASTCAFPDSRFLVLYLPRRVTHDTYDMSSKCLCCWSTALATSGFSYCLRFGPSLGCKTLQLQMHIWACCCQCSDTRVPFLVHAGGRGLRQVCWAENWVCMDSCLEAALIRAVVPHMLQLCMLLNWAWLHAMERDNSTNLMRAYVTSLPCNTHRFGVHY